MTDMYARMNAVGVGNSSSNVKEKNSPLDYFINGGCLPKVHLLYKEKKNHNPKVIVLFWCG